MKEPLVTDDVDQWSAALRSLAVAGALLFVPAAAAPAQDALGTGRALDASRQVGGDGTNTRAPVDDYRARNLLITGNVAGGRGFRGTVGYFAENDFRGVLGSDALFGFRADAALSSPAFIAAGRTSERVRYGAYLGVVEFQRDGGYGASTADLGRSRVTSRDMLDTRLALEQLAITGGADLSVASQPEVLGAVRDDSGKDYLASASPLRGLILSPMEASPFAIGLTSFDMARAREDVEAGRVIRRLGEHYPQSGLLGLLPPEAGAAPGAATDGASREFANRVESGLQADHRRILERIVDRYAQEPSAKAQPRAGVVEQLGGGMDRLRLSMSEALPPAAPGEQPQVETGPQPDELDLNSLAALLRHGERLERFAGGDPTRFNELVAAAERSLAAGEYFWAERRFARALRFTPGHPLATAGLAHAQIGAGLYVSAALGLRSLLADHPEMIDVRYAPSLLPNRVRLDLAARTVRERLEAEARDRPLRAFLLAYIGHQTEDRALVAEGLDVLARVAPDDPMLPVLRAVWLGREDRPVAPAPVPGG